MHRNKARTTICASICALTLLIAIHTQLLTPHFSHAYSPAPESKPKALRSFAAHLDSNWYPKEPEKLHTTIVQLDAQAQQQFAKQPTTPPTPADQATTDKTHIAPLIRAIIVPHAGYAYSGAVAAAVYRQLDPATIQNIIILAPSHQPFAGVALPDFDLYRISTGALQIHKALVHALAQQALFTYNNALFETEHSAEIQLPLIHYYLPSATITPLLIGDLSPHAIKQVALALAPHIIESTLLIISSDFTHYGPRFNYTPFKKYSKDQERLRIKQLDGQALQALEHQSLSEFSAYLARTHNTICGATPLAILLALLEQNTLKNTEMRLIAYETSASKSATPDPNSVSYVGAVFETKTKNPEQTAQKLGTKKIIAGTGTTTTQNSDPSRPLFTPHEKTELLETARTTLTNIFGKNVSEELLYPIKTKALSAPRGAFVTLYKKGKLRGCIGRTSTQEPLYKTVIAMTRAAALEDSRFSPVTRAELADIKISISVLTEPSPISSYKNIVLGKHGIILTGTSSGTQKRSALFLPSVAIDQGWDLPTTLTELSQKAGLPAEAWADPKTTYQVFESIDFSE